jgi:hypothetical protein
MIKLLSKERHLEILNATVKFYTDSPEKRGMDEQEDTCVYLGDDGNMCAVGFMFNEEGMRMFKNSGNSYEYMMLTHFDISTQDNTPRQSKEEKSLEFQQDFFKEEFQGIDIDVVIAIQTWHDSFKDPNLIGDKAITLGDAEEENKHNYASAIKSINNIIE